MNNNAETIQLSPTWSSGAGWEAVWPDEVSPETWSEDDIPEEVREEVIDSQIS